ncbi:MAG TPA: hypothetical protein DEB23_07070 [Chitinophagaceae bacterium]|nr:hypothetical protein [Chitinophagaceae bacterium]
MKSIYIVVDLLLASFYSFTLNGQTKFPTIINLSGDSKQIEGIIWDWSFGEQLLVNTLYSDKNFLLTTGFLQNDFGVSVNFKILETTTPFKIGPNPFIKNLKIHSDQSGIIISKIEMSNAQGQLLKIIQGPWSGIQFEQTISFTSANTGIYFISIHYVVGKSILKKQIFKVIKQ